MNRHSRLVNYTDGTPSREEEDWETTGQEEMNELYEKCKKQRPTVVSVRDRLNNLRELVDVCGAALLGDENKGQERIQRHVAHVLYFFVDEQLTTAEEELRHV